MSRQTNKERTRRRLIQAVLKVVQKYGLGALTTGRVAQLAGVAQPTFYVHFRSMDEALEHAANHVAQELTVRLSDTKDLTPTGSVAALSKAIQSTVESFTRDTRMAELFLQHRRDVTSPFGRRWADITAELRARAATRLRQMPLNASGPDYDIYAELLLGMVFGLVEGTLDGRITDLRRASEIAARSAIAGMTAASREVSAAA